MLPNSGPDLVLLQPFVPEIGFMGRRDLVNFVFRRKLTDGDSNTSQSSLGNQPQSHD